MIADLPKHAQLRAHPELRATIRAAYDQLLRARIAQAHYERCRGCGRDTDQTGATVGCATCSNRASRRARVADANLRAADNTRRRRARAKERLRRNHSLTPS